MKRKALFAILFLLMGQCLVSMRNSNADAKKVLMVIANKDFRDEELKIPFDLLKKERFEVIIASPELTTAKGMLGMSVEPDILLKDANPLEYDAVIFVGGVGAQGLWDNTDAHRLARVMDSQGKIVAAICIAPVILVKSGILQGKNATVWKSESQTLESKGTIYTGKPVEVDGNIITADGPFSADEFTEAVIQKLKVK